MSDDSLDFENLPFQAIYFFEELPTLDGAALARLIDGLDPTDEDKAVVHAPTEETTDTGELLQTFPITIGEIEAVLALQNAPSPHLFPIRICGLEQEETQRLLAHRCVAVATVVGGEEYLPVEKAIVLLKLAAAMREHGALGAHFLNSGLVLGGDTLSMLRSFAQEPRPSDGMIADVEQRLDDLKATGDPLADNLMGLLESFKQQLGSLSDEEVAEGSIWNTLRHQGEPPEFLIKLEIVPGEVCNMEPDDRVVVTHGCAQFGYPDIYYVSTDPEEDLEDVWTLLSDLFTGMMSRMTAMEPGATISLTHDDDPSFAVEEADEKIQLPWEHGELLELVRL